MKSVEQFTQKEIEMMEFREKLFLEQVEQYRAAVTGEQESILPFVRDENGVYSEEKAWNLIEKLIKCSEVYFQYMNQRRDSEKEEEFLNFWLNETYKEFLRDFFYCVIRISETNAWRNKQGATQTFQDFITFSKQEYADECELYKDEVFADIMRTGDYHFVKGIFGRADFLVRLLSEEFITGHYSEEKRKRYYPYLSEFLKGELGSEEAVPHEFAKALSEAEEEAIEMAMEQDGKKPDPENLVLKEQKLIKENFVQKEEFLKRYFNFRKELFWWLDEETQMNYTDIFIMDDEGEREQVVLSLEKIVRGALRLFAEINQLSCLQNDDAFFTAGAFLRQQSKEIKRLKKLEKR